LNANQASGAAYDRWAAVPIWKDPKKCVGKLSGSLSGTLTDPASMTASATGQTAPTTYQTLRVGGRFGGRSIDDSATPLTELLNPPLAPPVPEASRTGAGSVTALAEGCGPSPPPSPVDRRGVGCTFWAFLWMLLPRFLLFCMMFFMDSSGAPHDERSEPAASSKLYTHF